MKTAIRIDYQNKSILSDYKERDKEELEELQELIQKAASNKLTFLKFTKENISYYFPEKILSESIIAIVKDETTS